MTTMTPITIAPPDRTLFHFGQRWDSGVSWEDAVQMPAPVGHVCAQCCEHIYPHDRGSWTPCVRLNPTGLTLATAPVHMECQIRSAVGSVAHMVGGAPGPFRGTYRQEAHRVLNEINRVRHCQGWRPL